MVVVPPLLPSRTRRGHPEPARPSQVPPHRLLVKVISSPRRREAFSQECRGETSPCFRPRRGGLRGLVSVDHVPQAAPPQQPPSRRRGPLHQMIAIATLAGRPRCSSALALRREWRESRVARGWLSGGRVELEGGARSGEVLVFEQNVRPRSRTRGQRDLNQPQQRLGALQYRTREEKVNSSYLEWEG